MNKAESLGDVINRIKEAIRGDKKIKFIVLVGFLGMLLIFLSNGKSDAAETTVNAENAAAVSVEELTARTEEKLRDIVGSIDGVGRCEIMVTYENGIEYVYANEEKAVSDLSEEGEDGKKQEKISTENTPVIIERGRGKEALKIKEIQPRVRGVVVVCDGAQDVFVRQQIIDAVTTSMDISSAKVYVAKAAAKY